VTNQTMRIVLLLIIFIHGLIHLLGFVKGMGSKEVKELTLPISKPMGFLWLTASILFLTLGILQLFHSKYDWLVGFIAVVLSQMLVLLFWKDAKFGTLPNLLLLLVSITSYGQFRFEESVEEQTKQLVQQNAIQENKIMHENDLQQLPAPVKNWLRNSGAVGQPFITNGKVLQKAALKMKPEQEDWLHATATHYATIATPAFIWTVDVSMNPLLFALGRDTFENGKGEMLIKMNAIVTVVNEKGEKMDEGSLQRYLGEMVWFPSLALSPFITWEQVDDYTAKATMTYKGTRGSGTFHFNANGDIVKFTALRFMGNDATAKRHEWTMNITDYKTFEKIRVPSSMTSTWRLDEGDWTWLKLEVTDIKYNSKANH
jgi:hypothetical protein